MGTLKTVFPYNNLNLYLYHALWMGYASTVSRTTGVLRFSGLHLSPVLFSVQSTH